MDVDHSKTRVISPDHSFEVGISSWSDTEHPFGVAMTTRVVSARTGLANYRFTIFGLLWKSLLTMTYSSHRNALPLFRLLPPRFNAKRLKR